jgi:hypothetical protein
VLRVAAAVVPALTTAVALRAGAATWLQAGWVGLAVLILLGQALTVPEELRLGTSPARVLASNRALALVRGMLAGPGVAAVVVLVTMRFSPMPLAVAYGIAFGAVAAFGGASTTAWCQFQMTRFWLAAHGVLPLRTMAFLHDAERWGILRPVGGGYEFCDPHVRRRLVASAPPPIAPRQPQLGGAPARVGSPVR